LYARHHDHFPNQYAGVVAQLFPDGMDRATFDTFYQPPTAGVRLTGKKKPVANSGLQLGDIIVACNGYKVSNLDQYEIVRELNEDPVLDLVVWSGNKYEELKPNLPGHRFHSDLSNYTPGPHL
jgi:S1-C subfamily serine protease